MEIEMDKEFQDFSKNCRNSGSVVHPRGRAKWAGHTLPHRFQSRSPQFPTRARCIVSTIPLKRGNWHLNFFQYRTYLHANVQNQYAGWHHTSTSTLGAWRKLIHATLSIGKAAREWEPDYRFANGRKRPKDRWQPQWLWPSQVFIGYFLTTRLNSFLRVSRGYKGQLSFTLKSGIGKCARLFRAMSRKGEGWTLQISARTYTL